jgi:cell division protein ZapB
MNTDNKDKLELATLENRIDELIRTIEGLADENVELRNQKVSLANEKTELINKTEQARTRVEAMIIRLKALETRG